MGVLAGYHLDRLRELHVPRTHVPGGVPDDRGKSRSALAAEGWLDRPGTVADQPGRSGHENARPKHRREKGHDGDHNGDHEKAAGHRW
jgi:hypothetical protein